LKTVYFYFFNTNNKKQTSLDEILCLFLTRQIRPSACFFIVSVVTSNAIVFQRDISTTFRLS